MHSIIDEINEVEKQAAGVVSGATAAAKEALIEAQAQAQQQLHTQAEFARTKLREATQKAEAEGASLHEDILFKRAEETKAECEAANAKIGDAVQYLVGRVVNQE